VKADFLFKPTDPAAPVVKCVLYALPRESTRIPEAVKILRHVFEEECAAPRHHATATLRVS
jgi:hypothetical protein